MIIHKIYLDHVQLNTKFTINLRSYITELLNLKIYKDLYPRIQHLWLVVGPSKIAIDQNI